MSTFAKDRVYEMLFFAKSFWLVKTLVSPWQLLFIGDRRAWQSASAQMFADASQLYKRFGADRRVRTALRFFAHQLLNDQKEGAGVGAGRPRSLWRINLVPFMAVFCRSWLFFVPFMVVVFYRCVYFFGPVWLFFSTIHEIKCTCG